MKEKFLKEAVRLALKSLEKGDVPVGAVVVLDGKIVGRGFNQKESKQNACGHAEIQAIESACKKLGKWRLDDAELFVTLEPCLMCLGAVFNARIKAVYFGAKDNSASAIDGSRDELIRSGYMNHRVETYCDLCDQECQDMLVDFFKKRRLENKNSVQNKKS